jgi:hypothetical protein
MAKRKRQWTKRKRELARQKAQVTLKKRRKFICQARQKAETQFAGIIPLIEYQKKMLQLREKMSQRLQETKGKNAIFKTPDVALGMVTLLQMGLQYLEHIPHFLEEVKVAERLGLRHFFSENVVRDWIERKPREQTQGLKRLAQDYVLNQGLGEGEDAYIDVDQTSIRSYATGREGAVPGYGSHGRGPCYQAPRVSVNGLNFDWALKPGNEHGGTYYDIALQVAETLLGQGKAREVILRSDSGFAAAERLKQVQKLAHRFPNFHFIMAASAGPKESALLKLIEEAKSMAKKRWRKVSPTTSVLEFSQRIVYKEEGLKARAVLIKQQRTLTKRLGRGKGKIQKVKEDHFYFLLTAYRSSECNAQNLFRDYHGRQNEEHLFRDSKQARAFLHLPDQSLAANELYVSLVLLSQTLRRLYQKQVLHKKRRLSYAPTLHDWFIKIGGKNQGPKFDLFQPPLPDSQGNSDLDQKNLQTVCN